MRTSKESQKTVKTLQSIIGKKLLMIYSKITLRINKTGLVKKKIPLQLEEFRIVGTRRQLDWFLRPIPSIPLKRWRLRLRNYVSLILPEQYPITPNGAGFAKRG